MTTRNGILEEMQARPNWVLWRLEKINDRTTKVPYQISGYKASSKDPRHWSNYETAFAAYKRGGYNGIGYVFTSEIDLVFIDIDHCIDEEGRLSTLAQDALDTIGNKAYWEISQSGHGLHAFVRGRIPALDTGEGSNKITKLGLEAYCRERYVAFTGNTFPNVPEGTGTLLEFYEEYFPIKGPSKASPGPVAISAVDDLSILARCHRNAKFEALFNGNWEGLYPSHSEADIALCEIVAFYSGRNAEMIDSVFRASALMRDKWDRVGPRTIAKAIALCNEDVSEFKERKQRERRDAIERYYLQSR